MKPTKLVVFSFSVLFLAATALPGLAASGEVYYVDKNHPAASDSNPGTESQPWKTIQKAASTLQAGETVLVKAGVYTELYSGTPETAKRGIKPQNSGTAGAPITYKAYPGDNVVVDQQMQGTGFLVTKDHIVISGFEIRNAIGGGVNVSFSGADYVTVENNHIHHIDGGSGDNVGGIKFNACGWCVADNNRIHDIYVGGVFYHDAAGIHSYDMHDTVIKNNDISRAARAVFHKRSSGQKGAVIHNNVFHDVDEGIFYGIGGTGDPGHFGHEVYENVFYNMRNGVVSRLWETSTASEGLSIHSNVFAAENAVILGGYRGVEVWDNIFLGNGRKIVTTDSSSGWDSHIDFADYNLYDGGIYNIIAASGSEKTYRTIDEWRTAGSFPGITGTPGANSLVTSAGFVDAGAHDYHLLADSPAVGTGRYSQSIGAYPDGSGVIGLANRPLAPTDIVVR